MLIDFFLHLKAKKLPVSTREFLILLEALKEGIAGHSIDDFYGVAQPGTGTPLGLPPIDRDYSHHFCQSHVPAHT